MNKLTTYLCGRKKSAFAEQIGISPAYLSQITSGARTPSLDVAIRIERATDGAVPASAWIGDAA